MNDMEIRIKKISSKEPEAIEIYCHEINDAVKEIVSFVKSRQGQLTGQIRDKKFTISYTDIYYIEAVDDRVFLYCKDKVYETGYKLYQLENVLGKDRFLRISKSVIVNLMKIEAIKPALNSRFIAFLKNGEQVIISRKYVSVLKKTLMGEH